MRQRRNREKVEQGVVARQNRKRKRCQGKSPQGKARHDPREEGRTAGASVPSHRNSQNAEHEWLKRRARSE